MALLAARVVLVLFCGAVWGQDDPERLPQNAIALHQAGEFERAIPQYRAYLKVKPGAAKVPVEPRRRAVEHRPLCEVTLRIT